MGSVTILLVVSRSEYLDVIFPSLELLVCDRRNTNLLVVVDGGPELYVNVRNRVMDTKFAEKLCVQFKSDHKLRHFDIQARRLRISDIHNFAKQHIKACDYVFGVEDDTIVPATSLRKLLGDYSVYPYAGFIQGVELGRWGIPYVGAWKVDDIYEPTRITSLLPVNSPARPSDQIQEVDAGGLYCFLTKRDNYVNHNFKPFDRNGLGPDVDFGVSLRQAGSLNYTDWRVKCIHKSKRGDIKFHDTDPRVIVFTKRDGRWRQGQRTTS